MPHRIFVMLMVLLAYGSVTQLGFVSDDHGLITHPNTGVASQSWTELVESDLWHFQESQSGYYRPLMMLSLKLDHLLFGYWAPGYHLHSLAWHLATVWLLGVLVSRHLGPRPGSTAAMLYGLHPLVTEQVAFISARNDSMASALGLGAILAVTSSARTRGRLAAGGILAAAACLAKENALIVFALLPLTEWARHRKLTLEGRHAALLSGVLAAALVRALLGPGLSHTPPLAAADMVASKAVILFGFSIGKLVWPWPLTDSTHLAYLASAEPIPAVVAAMIVAALLYRGGRWAVAGLVFALLSMVPGTLAIASRYLIADRYLALAVMGLSIAAAAAIPTGRRWGWAAVFCIPLAWSAHQRSLEWKTDLSLAAAAHQASPTPYTAAWLGHELARSGDTRAALPLLEAATSGSPPTCDFSAEWIRLTSSLQGATAGVAVARQIWDRGCAAAPGVRGSWALAHLQAGQIEEARNILTPPPPSCNRWLAAPVVTLAMLDNDLETATNCRSTAGLDRAELEAVVAPLLSHLQQRSRD